MPGPQRKPAPRGAPATVSPGRRLALVKKYEGLIEEMGLEMGKVIEHNRAGNFGVVAEHMDMVGTLARRIAEVARRLAEPD